MLRSLHESIVAEEDDPPFGTPTNLDDDGLIPQTDINDEDGGGLVQRRPVLAHLRRRLRRGGVPSGGLLQALRRRSGGWVGE